MRYLFTLLFCSSFLILSFAQKKTIDHTVYDEWKTLSHSIISSDGKFVSYQIKPHKGDGFLYIYKLDEGKLDSIPRGEKAVFAGDNSFVSFVITPHADSLRKCELDKVKKDKWPKDSLAIYYLATDSLVKFPRIKSFQTSEEGNLLVMMSEDNKIKEENKKKKRSKDKEYKSDGNALFVIQDKQKTLEIKDVKDYTINEKGTYICYTTHKKEKSDSIYLHLRDLKSDARIDYAPAYTDIQKLLFHADDKYLTYFTSGDTSKQKNYTLRLIEPRTNRMVIIADSATHHESSDQAPSIHFSPVLTASHDQMLFGMGERAKAEEKDTLLESEKAKLDVWNYKDARLQPQQLKELQRDKKSSILYAYDLTTGEHVRLSSDSLDVYTNEHWKADWLLARSNTPYQSRFNWEYPWKYDFYLVNRKNAEKKLMLRGNPHYVSLSPDAKSFVYFENGSYYLKHTESDSVDEMSLPDSAIWVEDMNGMPAEASNYSIVGWTSPDTVVLQSRHDLYYYVKSSKEVACITCLVNEKQEIEIRPVLWKSDSLYIDLSKGVFIGFDTKSKGTHVYQFKVHGDHSDVVELEYFDAETTSFTASEDASTVTFRKMTVKDYPDLYVYRKELKSAKRISRTNLQQDEYRWPTVELIKWNAYDGTELEGLLYKPEDFDSTKSYPLLVYYYELHTDRFHQHYIPKPTASIIYATEYASAGYVVLMPDIRYKTGYPAKSAYNAIMSATDHVLKLYPNIDSTRMGLQGQSWGGYQTAQLITMTNRYRAAMAGAPVSNMFSAYGGIRWGSGLNRQFQYEKSQSRIGATIWEKPELYFENSPLFHIPKISTPLLIMHNDNDGAVPWYQGIEMFTAMKRLDKVVWLLNYNEDDHNLMKDANRRDLSIRMRQFFDHYLMGQAAPKWMTNGIPALEKGLNYGLELDNEE